MADDSPAVSLRNVSKMYRLFDSPKHRMLEALHPFRKKYHHEFWALRDITLDIPRGTTLGIMGRNGSGKSTLLQLICSVLTPTTGTVEVRGRVAALLELGAGFNPEFTGRDNAIFNGIVAGFSREEMEERLPDIAAFADIGEFFDQPVKTYSSGMFVRLAFATAIQVDADILVIDEALAVGDARFQHKCFTRLAELQKLSKTIIFVTHSPAQVTAHCGRALLLDGGALVVDGNATRVVDRYLDLMLGSPAEESLPARGERSRTQANISGSRFAGIDDFVDLQHSEEMCHLRPGYNPDETRYGNGMARIVDYVLESDGQFNVTSVESGRVLSIYFKVVFLGGVSDVIAGFAVKTVDGIQIYGTNTYMLGCPVPNVIESTARILKFALPLNVCPGSYFFDLGVARADGTSGGTALDVRRSVAHCVVVASRAPSFDGLTDLSPTFEDVTDSLGRTTRGSNRSCASQAQMSE